MFVVVSRRIATDDAAVESPNTETGNVVRCPCIANNRTVVEVRNRETVTVVRCCCIAFDHAVAEVIETETNRIIDTSNCDWLNDLITAVFISHTKILTAIGSNNSSNIELIIPKTKIIDKIKNKYLIFLI